MRVSDNNIKIILLLWPIILFGFVVSAKIWCAVRFYCPVLRAHKVELVYVARSFLGVITAF